MHEIAKRIHNESIIFDAHLDLGGIIYNNRIKGKKEVLNELFLKDFRKVGVKFVIAAIFVENDVVEMALKRGLLQIEAIKSDINECKDFMIIRDSKDMEKSIRENKIGLILSLEGLEPIHKELELLNTFYELGVRGFGVTWARRNLVADGSYFRYPDEGVLGGLTPFGIQVMRRAEHSNAREINKMPRNLSDDQIRKIASRNGVIGVNAYTEIVSPNENEQNVIKLCDHVDHLVKISSDKNVGFGFDLCTKYYDNGRIQDVLKSHEEVILITEELLKRKYSEESIKNIIGLNFYDYILKALN